MSDYELPLTQGKSDSLEDWDDTNSRCVNWVFDQQGCLHQRPAIAQLSGTVATSGYAIIGSYVWRSPIDLQTYFVYVRSDRFIRALNLATMVTSDLSSTAFPTTLLDGTGARAIFTENTIYLIIAGGGQLQRWPGNGFTARLDPSFTWDPVSNQPTTGATHATFLSNYIIANNNVAPYQGQFWWSNLGDANSVVWNPLNFNTADAAPDRVTGVYSSLSELFVFGERTLQVYGIDGSDQFNPFSTACSIRLGCSAPYSPVALENQFAWLDDERRIVISDGRSFEVISKDVTQTLKTLSYVADAWGFRAQTSYYDVLFFVFPTAGLCLVYSLSAKTWGTWETLDQMGNSNAPRFGSLSYWPPTNTIYIGDANFENVFKLDPFSNQDVGGSPIGADMILNRDDYGAKGYKATNYVDIFMKRGQSTAAGLLEIAVRDDDAPWQPYHLENLGVPGDYKSNVRWYPGGVWQRRQFRIRYSGSGDMAISGIVENFTPRG